MTVDFDKPMVYLGVAEDRRREQFTVDILRHRAGEPGHVYVAQVLAKVRANSLDELWREMAAYTGDDRRLTEDDDDRQG